MLSKSNFRSYLECPCLLWLEKVRPDLLPSDHNDELQHIFEEGRKVDVESRKLHPGGFEVEGFVKDGWKNTRAALVAGHDVLFQPTAVAGEMHARADILTRNGSSWDIREVKSSTQVKDEHILDLAFQRLCFEGAKVPIGRTHLVHINNRYVRHGAVEPAKLFKSEDVTAAVKTAMAEMRGDVRSALAITAWPKKPGQANADACTDPAHCEYLGYYLHLLPAALRARLEETRRVAPLPDPPIVRIDKPGLKRKLAVLRYPLQYLDYETYSPAIPMFDGYRSYQRVTFQYSLHAQDAAGAKLRHAEYLEQENVDPAPRLAAHLMENAAKGGTFVAWNASFEKGCNTEMGERNSGFAKFFESVNGRMFDPMWIFKKKGGLYLHSSCGGSASLKKVLPVIVPSLSYKSLDIQEGETASNSWPVLTDPKTPAAKKKKLYEDMLAYCGLDTFAMTKIIEHLQGLE